MAHHWPAGRRQFIQSIGFGAALLTTRGLFAQTLTETARLTEGPFYPDRLPLDVDSDLLVINDAITPAVGEVTYLSGRILTTSGEPVRNATVEIWQCDARGSYIHSRGRNTQSLDGNFQGFGRFETVSSGEYAFRTIKPVPYTLRGQFRAPHIHMAIDRNGRRIHTTQAHIRGHADNPRDGVLSRLDASARETVLVDFRKRPGSRLGELAATFDVVISQRAR